MTKVNLNTASRDELTRIEGVGGECADAIIQYREEHGRIKNVEELSGHLSGFGQKAMQHLRQDATI